MPLQIPHPSKPLHLYRHLLREASYLPPLCRPWITERVQTRFRDCRALDTKDSEPCIHQAHRDLRYLRAANAGDTKRMLRIFYMVLGRLGKRRRELQREYLASEPAVDSAVLGKTTGPQSLSESLPNKVEAELEQSRVEDVAPKRRPIRQFDWLDHWSQDKVLALAKSQVDNQTPAFPVQMRSITDPKRALPKMNCWGRPFPRKVARHKLRRHFARLLAQLMAPLPKGEWDMLKALALGETEDVIWAIPSRRTVAVSSNDSVDLGNATETWKWEQYLAGPARKLQRSNSRTMKILSGDVDDDPRGQRRAIGTHVYKPRFLRRSIYGALWESSPLLQKTRKGRWKVEWGRSDAKVSAPSTSELQFFRSIGRGKQERASKVPGNSRLI